MIEIYVLLFSAEVGRNFSPFFRFPFQDTSGICIFPQPFFGPMKGTNNIGEFLAIVHGLALLKKKGFDMPIYSDSANAISWVRQKKCKTKLPRNEETEELFTVIERAEKWLRENTYTTRILKWETKVWGEIPADFGRK